MTGGVTTEIKLNRVLFKQKLWNELLNVKKHFIFAASSPGAYGDDSDARQGIALGHAYSVMRAVEEVGEDDKKIKLVLIRNPWGLRNSMVMGEWSGAWSDGSKEWTPYWMKKLNHTFGDDGIFWISFDDLCRKFEVLERTRLFDDTWTVVQQWTSVNVSYLSGYLTTKFTIEVNKAGTVVIVLSQVSPPLLCSSYIDPCSSIPGISKVSKANITSSSISSSATKMPPLASTSFVSVHPAAMNAVSRPKSSLSLVLMKFYPRSLPSATLVCQMCLR
jgi:hypothetical protein